MKRQMRIISMSLTKKQFLDGSKDVTRRVGWRHAKVGMRLRVVEKAMGLQKGERMKTLGFIQLTHVSSEPLSLLVLDTKYGTKEIEREGFPNWTPDKFVTFFCESHAVKPYAVVTRLEYKKIDIDDGGKYADHASEQVYSADHSADASAADSS